MEVLNAQELVEDALRMNDAALGRHGVKVVREYQKTPLVTVDRHKALQILINLIRNSKYAMDESHKSDKTLTVAVLEGGNGCVRIEVRDNGIGIPPENLTRIFQHGFTTKQQGHGFGLHSAANAAKEMGGYLTAQSDGPGQGAVFSLELPAASLATNGPISRPLQPAEDSNSSAI
jgi:signal transduction histidine kinase